MILMVLTIGRDACTGQLNISVGNNIINGEIVSQTVSKKHARLEVTDKGEYILTNLNIENVTFVKSLCIEQKQIIHGDRIELGAGHYQLSWDVLDRFLPKFADIRPLERVWEDYKKKSKDMEIEERRFGVRRSFPGILTLSIVVIGQTTLFSFIPQYIRLIVYVISLLLTLVLYLIAEKRAKSVPEEREQILSEARHKYICPLCNTELPFQEYNQLKIHTSRCPNANCQAYFIR